MAVGMCGLYLADIILLVAGKSGSQRDTSMWNWLSSNALLVGPIALNNIGWKFFLVLIIPTALHIVFVYFMCPETKGRSLVRSNALFNSLQHRLTYLLGGHQRPVRRTGCHSFLRSNRRRKSGTREGCTTR